MIGRTKSRSGTLCCIGEFSAHFSSAHRFLIQLPSFCSLYWFLFVQRATRYQNIDIICGIQALLQRIPQPPDEDATQSSALINAPRLPWIASKELKVSIPTNLKPLHHSSHWSRSHLSSLLVSGINTPDWPLHHF